MIHRVRRDLLLPISSKRQGTLRRLRHRRGIFGLKIGRVGAQGLDCLPANRDSDAFVYRIIQPETELSDAPSPAPENGYSHAVVLQRVQPALLGLMDGSVSTL